MWQLEKGCFNRHAKTITTPAAGTSASEYHVLCGLSMPVSVWNILCIIFSHLASHPSKSWHYPHFAHEEAESLERLNNFPKVNQLVCSGGEIRIIAFLPLKFIFLIGVLCLFDSKMFLAFSFRVVKDNFYKKVNHVSHVDVKMNTLKRFYVIHPSMRKLVGVITNLRDDLQNRHICSSGVF